MYEFSPKPRKNLLYFIIFSCAILGIVSFAPFDISEKYSLWLKALGFVLLAAAFILADRYVMTYFSYSIEKNDEGGIDFCVREIRYRRARVVCRVYLHEIKEIKKIKKGKQSDISRGALVFNYRRDFLPSEHFLIRGEGKDGEFFIRFSPDDEMVNIIRDFLGL